MYSTTQSNDDTLILDHIINPWLKEIPKDDRYLNNLLNIGYNATKTLSLQNDDSYVSDKINSINELNKKQLELYAHQTTSKINELVSCISSLQTTMNSNTSNTHETIRMHNDKIVDIVAQITGKVNKSAHIGQIGENYVLNVLRTAYPKAIFELSVSEAHQADIHMTTENGLKIFIEVKNYTSTIQTKEVEKFRYDLKTNDIKLGLFLSFGEKISKMHNKFHVEDDDDRLILYASCLEQNPSDVILSLEALLRIYDGNKHGSIDINKNISEKLPQIIKMTEDLDELFCQTSKNLEFVKEQRKIVMKSMDELLTNTVESNSKIRNIVIDVRDNIVSNICDLIELPDEYETVEQPDFTGYSDKVSNIYQLIFDSLPSELTLNRAKKDEFAIKKSTGEIVTRLNHNKGQTKVTASKVLGNDIKWTITNKNIDSFINFISA